VDVETLSLFFALLSLACVAGVLVVAVLTASGALGGPGAGLRAGLGPAALALGAAVAVVATAGSLYYSEVVGFVPCKLCWFQRIAMYPLALLLPIAAVRRDRGVRPYALPLSVLGLGVSAYHTWLQAYPPSGGSGFCTADAPCTDRHVWELGFVSIPFMALTGFAFITAMLVVARPSPRSTETTEVTR
jgi:disulfide bond formation protein DsbB